MRQFFALVLFWSSFLGADYTLVLCAIFQDEAPYLKEWIEYHRMLGVDRFILYNHLSTDNFHDVLNPYIEKGLVELHNLTEPATEIAAFNRLQCDAYNKTLKEMRGVAKWVAFLDIDEFILPLQKENLPELLKEFEEVGGLAVQWRIYGTSGLKKIPEGKLLIESLTRCTKANYSLNRHIKSIVRPERASHFINPHDAIYFEGYSQVNSDKIPFTNRFSPYFRANKVRINHYWTRDEDYFFNKKIARQKRWGGTPDSTLLLQEMNEEEDRLILRFVPALRKILMLECDIPAQAAAQSQK